ncbi:MAG: chromosomal replication initiator protein DnaA [Melioribacteraceae bacterium]|nr:chromosomal replication initiator protein DnaA [Melioribacteraceae bacterium]
MAEAALKLDSYKEHITIWKECLSLIKENVSLLTYNTWFLPLKPLHLERNILKLQVPNNYFIDWIEEHHKTLITNVIHNVLGVDGKLIYLIIEEQEDTLFDKKSEPENIVPPFSEPKPVEKNYDDFLNSKFTFENFVKGEGNQLARAASIAIGENPGQTSFNPLFIYGGVGLGKTHLIQAIGNKILDKDPNKKVIYVSSDLFTVEFVEAIQNNSVNEFSNFYKGMDALIIDDIQFLVGKEKTQDLFFNIFNTLHLSGRQIILSSDKPPKDLKGVSERLVSRFQCGLTVDIQPPDFETRLAILNNKARLLDLTLDPQAIEYIAHNITSNIRELEGTLLRLLATHSLNSKAIDFDMVKRVVKEISTNRQVNISIEYITKIVCEFFKVEENKVREKNRRKEVVLARQVAMYLAKSLTKSSLKTIGLHFGGRDHSTVIHACNTIEESMSSDYQLNESVTNIKNKIEVSVS